MATIWLTYAWIDNKDSDVDFIVQELIKNGVGVKLDRWNLTAGKRLWEQIEHFIQSKEECDAWVMYATTNSLGSEACKEEFAYALDRALNSRGESFPVIGLFPSAVNEDLIPAGIRTRLYVSTNDPDWKERIKAGAEGRRASISISEIKPYVIKRYAVDGGSIIEVRPRAGEWYPFVAGIPLEEKEKVGGFFHVMPGPVNQPPKPTGGFFLHYDGEGEGGGNGIRWLFKLPHDSASPLRSMYIVMKDFPTLFLFGIMNGSQWVIPIAEID